MRAGNVASVFGFDDGEARFVRAKRGEDLVNLLRFAKERYRQSDLYTGDRPAIVLDPYVDAASFEQAAGREPDPS